MAVASEGTSMEYTPTWALATVYFFFIFTAVFLRYSIHLLANVLAQEASKSCLDAVEKLKSELMLLGFASLLLAVTQDSISKFCIPAKLVDTMLPCRKKVAPESTRKEEDAEHFGARNFSTGAGGSYGEIHWLLAEEAVSDSCSDRKLPFMKKHSLHQLHILIFVLAVMHIVYSVLTMALGRAKMRSFQAWEKDAQAQTMGQHQVAHDPNLFRFTRQTTGGRRDMNSCTENRVQLWIKCFSRQFYNSIEKAHYLTLRHGFISTHLSSRHNNFNFQRYIQLCLEEDFRIMVGISPLMWFLAAAFMLLDVYGWYVYLWISYVPILVVLVLGTKLEHIVATMALQIKEQNSAVSETPLVQHDDRFWFRKPKYVLVLLHYTLFVNAFEFAFFIWVTIQFGLTSCYHEHTVIIVTRVFLAVTAQVLCSYITLPLYALVAQMGSQFKSHILEDKTADILRKWRAEVRHTRKMEQQLSQSEVTSFSTEWSSMRKSLTSTEVPSNTRQASKPAQSIQLLSSRWEIKHEIVEQEGSSSRA
ncbi:PREDICTED: MLO-like protein 3 [Prunus mume]|uniref:MLO-like protein n=1 Tax=Prunus mume TaxID=102107 RepID=A0ABM1LXS3_PRUMU|nr:PREDICTED: MLO-like protein 3 [Prunus mume]